MSRLLFPDALLICVVAYAISISMAKIFAAKHNYKVDANQELIAQVSHCKKYSSIETD